MTDPLPLVSAIIPTYNRPELLQRAIRSVLDQTYDNIELIVVDDCSPTRLDNIVQSGSPDTTTDIIFKRHDTNRGVAAARNTGMEVATGEFIAFLDDDDQWIDSKIATQVQAFNHADPQVGVVYTESDINRFEDSLPSVRRLSSTNLTKQLLCKNVVGTPSKVMVRSECVESAGGFDERFPNWEDQAWYITLSKQWAFERVPVQAIKYSQTSPNRASEDFETLRDEVYHRFIAKFEPLAKQYGNLFRRKMLAWAAYRVGKVGFYTNNYAEGQRFLWRAIRTYPLQGRFYVFPIYKSLVRELYS